MKKNPVRTLSLVALILVLVILLLANTYARYTSTQTNSDTARVAKWSFEVNDTDLTSTTNTFTFNLFNTINDTTGGAETDISNTTGAIIAPGTQGSFDIVLENLSEVTADYAIDYTVTNSNNIPVEFSTKTGSGEQSDWSADLADVVASESTKLDALNGTTTITVYWKWAIDASTVYAENKTNVTDTALGTAGTATITVQAQVTATQVD